jgi:hypothetical protein
MRRSFKQYIKESKTDQKYIEEYWDGLVDVIKTRGWEIDPNGKDSWGNPVGKDTRVVIDSKTGKKRFHITRMIDGSVFIMEQTATKDEQGDLLKGLNVLDLIYPYEKQFLLDRPDIEYIRVNPVNSAVMNKLRHHYPPEDGYKRKKIEDYGGESTYHIKLVKKQHLK